MSNISRLQRVALKIAKFVNGAPGRSHWNGPVGSSLEARWSSCLARDDFRHFTFEAHRKLRREVVGQLIYRDADTSQSPLYARPAFSQ